MNEQQVSPPSYEHIPIDDSLELRAISPAEAQTMFNLTENNRAYLAEYLPWVNTTKTVNASRAFIQATETKRSNGEEYGFGIIVEGEPVGHISLMHLTDGKLPEIGYWVAESSSGKGITTKAAQAVTAFGFDTLGLERILIRAVPNNIGSNRVAEKLGYTLEDTAPDEDGQIHNRWIKHR